MKKFRLLLSNSTKIQPLLSKQSIFASKVPDSFLN